MDTPEVTDTRHVVSDPRLSRGVDRKLTDLEDAIKSMREAGAIDPAEIMRLASEVHRESAEPVFMQVAKRQAGATPANAPMVPTGMING